MNTGVGCHSLLQGIFLTQGWNHVSRICGTADRFFTISATREAPNNLTHHLIELFLQKQNSFLNTHFLYMPSLPNPAGNLPFSLLSSHHFNTHDFFNIYSIFLADPLNSLILNLRHRPKSSVTCPFCSMLPASVIPFNFFSKFHFCNVCYLRTFQYICPANSSNSVMSTTNYLIIFKQLLDFPISIYSVT